MPYLPLPLPDDMKSSSSSCFTMDADAINAVTYCLPTIFDDNQKVYSDELSLINYQRYHELWDYLDLDNDDAISRQDLQLGMSILAENFIAVDDVSQQIANSYLQRKILKAMRTVHRLQERPLSSSAAAAAVSQGINADSPMVNNNDGTKGQGVDGLDGVDRGDSSAPDVPSQTTAGVLSPKSLAMWVDAEVCRIYGYDSSAMIHPINTPYRHTPY